MFYDRFVQLCRNSNKSPSRAALEIGLSKATVSNWKKNGYTPRNDVLIKIADYFNVSTEYLLIGQEKEQFTISAEEEAIIIAYRNKPEMREAVCVLLGIK